MSSIIVQILYIYFTYIFILLIKSRVSTKYNIISFLTYTCNIGLKNSNKKLKTYLNIS